jgi:hypothetical protein
VPLSTVRGQFPYPVSTDPDNVPADIRALADRLAAVAAVYVETTAVARPAATEVGRLHRATDTGVISYDTGTAWVELVNRTDANAAYAEKAQEGFRAFRTTSGQTLAAATFTTVILNAETVDEGADYDPATGQWTVPVTGWYDVAASVRFVSAAAGERTIVSLAVGGAETVRLHDITAGASGEVIGGGATPIRLTAGNVVTVQAFRGAAGDIGPESSLTWFTAKRRH